MREAAGVTILALQDVGIDKIDIAEDADTFAGNAKQKLEFVLSKLPSDRPMWVAADDAGLSVDALNGAPGVRSRRWRDGVTEMSDQEIIDYALEQLKDVPYAKRDASFTSVVALAHSTNPSAIQTFEGVVRGKILQQADTSQPMDGLPYRRLFYVPEVDRMLGDTAGLDPETAKLHLTHRQLAFQKAFRYLADLASVSS